MTVTYIDIAMGSGPLTDWIDTTRCVLPAWLHSLPSWSWPFVVPDFCAPSQSFWQWVTLLFAHFGFIAALGFFSPRIALGVLKLWAAKEGIADLPISGWHWQVVLDSTIDLSAGILGFAALKCAHKKSQKQRCGSCGSHLESDAHRVVKKKQPTSTTAGFDSAEVG